MMTPPHTASMKLANSLVPAGVIRMMINNASSVSPNSG